jgi:predicted dehydrogenase
MGDENNGNGGASRRDFLKTTAAAATAAVAMAHLSPSVYAAGSERIRVGLVGCGGRGTGAATDSLNADPATEIVAMGDLFKDRLDKSYDTLKKMDKKLSDRVTVKDDQKFTGFDAYKKVIDSDIDLVLLCEPPGFRPTSMPYAVSKGRHVFFEKPVAVDPVGIRKIMAASEEAASKKLTVIAGTCFRHEYKHHDIIKRIQDGAIGPVRSGESFYNVGGLWHHARQPEWTDTEYQIRNWLYFTWLSGDHFIEQHIHRVDVMQWIVGMPPKAAYGVGGRQVRTDPAYGYVYDHFSVEYEFPNGVRWMSQCRQTDGTDSRVQDIVIGTKGTAKLPEGSLQVDGEKLYKSKPPEGTPTMYVQEHIDLIDSLRGGGYRNEGKQIAEVSLTGIMGRMAAYTGKTVTWEQALNSKLDLWPKEPIAFGPREVPPVPMPGREPLI